MLGLSGQTASLIFLVLITPICLWVVFTDLKYMKIRNTAVLAMLAVFAVGGLFLMPVELWVWRWVNFAVVLGVGFLLNLIAHFGAGDAKFAAAAAPLVAVAPEHLRLVMLLLCAFLLAAFTAHRILRKIPAVRAMAPDWVSWQRADFPMGLALVGTIWTYLAVLAGLF